jgi:hypothetical protein
MMSCHDFDNQDPLPDVDMEEDRDHEILAILWKHMPSCIDAAEIEQLLWDIPVQQQVAVPVRMVS